MMEEEEEEIWSPMRMSDIAHMRAEASEGFQGITGIKLPTIPDIAEHPSSIRVCDWIPQGIPEGSLLYPCCGSDIEDALRRFGPFVSACHFADPFDPPLVKRIRENNRPVAIPNVVNIVPGIGHTWTIERDELPCPVVVHQKDGLLTLLQDISHLAVFYYRGDSQGEGGSDQRWLWPVLFEVVISRLLEGGIVCTDGSNSNCWSEGLSTYSPFVMLGGNPPRFLPRSRVGDKIVYGPRTLECIAELQGKNQGSTMLAWRVKTHLSRNL